MNKTKLIVWWVVVLWIASAFIAQQIQRDDEEERVVALVRELFRDRKYKDTCLNDLNYSDSKLVAEGLKDYCQDRNETMEQLYKSIMDWITFPYQELDKKVEQAKDEKFIQQVDEVSAEQTHGSATEKLETILGVGL